MMRKTVLTYGLLSGIMVLLLWFVTRNFWMAPDGKMDMSKGEIWGYIDMIISLSMVFFGVRHFRDKYQDGRINFRKALWVGFLIALVASLVYMVGWAIYYNTSDFMPQFMDQYMAYMKQKWVDSGMSAEELAKKSAEFQKNMEMYKNPFLMALLSIFEILPVGLLVALISALILRKK